MDNIRITTLGRIALGIALVGTGGLYALRWTIQSKIRESVTYGEALKCFRANENAVDILGEPIKAKKVEIGDNNCYGRKDNVSWVTVPLEGKKRNGKLHYRIDLSDSDSEKYRLSRVELSIDGASVGKILLKDGPADSKIEVPTSK